MVDHANLTHIGFILESIFTPPTMEMRRTLTVEDAVLHEAFLCRAISLKALLVDCRVLAVVVRMHLNVACADVSLITFILNAVIVCLLPVVLAIAELNCAIVRGCEAQESMIQ